MPSALSKQLGAFLVCALLSACGGGSADAPAPAPAAPPSTAAYEGDYLVGGGDGGDGGSAGGDAGEVSSATDV